MKYIIFDLELTCWEGAPPDNIREVIEIAAFEVSAFGEIRDEFHRYVQPHIHPYLSPYCRELTGIEQRDINRASSFGVVASEFVEWSGYYDNQEFTLISWGNLDKQVLVQECASHGIDPAWLSSYVDLKEEYRELKRLPKKVGLVKAMRKEGLEFVGFHHSGRDDAYNLCRLFATHIDEWQLI